MRVVVVRLYKSNLIRVALAVVAVVLAFVWRRRVVHGFHAMMARVPSSFFSHHQVFTRALHIVRNVTPDIAFILLALAGLSYLIA